MKSLIEKFVKHIDIQNNAGFIDQLRVEMSGNLASAVENKIDWKADTIDTAQSKYTASINVMNDLELKTAKDILLAVIKYYPDAEADIRRAITVIDPMGQF
jgi:hypothetical protein